jgi:hypothetical protein
MASETPAQLLSQVSAGEPMCPLHSSLLAVSLSVPVVQAVCRYLSHPKGMACGVFTGGGQSAQRGVEVCQSFSNAVALPVDETVLPRLCFGPLNSGSWEEPIYDEGVLSIQRRHLYPEMVAL